MPSSRSTALHLLSPAGQPTRSAPRPSFLTAAGGFDREAIMLAAHAEARANVARAAARGVVRRYRAALRCALKLVWSDARSARHCFTRDAAMAALPVTHAAILAERTAALMIDSTQAMVAELAAIDARALAMGVALRLPPPEPRKPRRRWKRLDVARPEPLPSADPIVPQLDAPEPLTRAEVTMLLSAPARTDLRAGSLAGNAGGRV